MRFVPLTIKSVSLKIFIGYLVAALVLLLIPASWSGPVRHAVLLPFALGQRLLVRVLHGAERASQPEEVRRLRQQVTELTTRLAEETERRTAAEARLDQMSRLPPEVNWHTLHAEIISYDPSPYRRIAVINVGSRAGVVTNAVVLWNGVLLGRVDSTGPRTCRAVLLGDPQCRVSVRCARSRARGILEGTGAGTCLVKYVDLSADVELGDLFVTAGTDQVFPGGRLVGECAELSTEPGDFFKQVLVKPAFDLPELDEVVIILPETDEEQE